MIRMATEDDEVVLYFKNKGIYSHLTDLCENRNDVVDTCNGSGRDGPHTLDNTLEGQKVAGCWIFLIA